MTNRPAPRAAQQENMSADDVLVALRDSDVLDTLEVTSEDLEIARTDSNLLETLRITNEILTALRESGVQDTFLQLPRADQANFLRWIGMTDDHQLRHERTETFVSALKMSPLS